MAPGGVPIHDEEARERNRDEEFPSTALSRASNNSPRGIWSDGDVMYVADGDPENGYQVALDDVPEITVTVTSADGSRERIYRVLVGDPGRETPSGPGFQCIRGAVAVGFSLVVYAGGSVGELVACAQSRHGTALYTLHDGGYVPYILGAPDFVNSSFGELFAGGLPAITPLIIKSDGPPTDAPAGSITGDDLTPPWPDCLRGMPAVTPLVAKSDPPLTASADSGDAAGT